MKIDNNDYTEIPNGQAWIHQAWSGDMAAAPYYMPKGTPVEVVGYWFPTNGRGPVANDTNTVLRSATNPVLAHLFLNYMLDLPNVLENISYNGYMQPLNACHPAAAGQGEAAAAQPDVHRRPAVLLPSRVRGAATARGCRRAVAAGLARREQRDLAMAIHAPPRPVHPPKGSSGADSGRQSRAFWIALALPGILWLAVLFIVPFYAVLAIAQGKLNRLTESPVAVYNPLTWSSANLSNVWHDIFGADSFAGPIVVRTVVYVLIASVLCLAHGLPGRLLRRPLRRAAQGPVPGPADRAVLDQLHDAHAGLDRPAADRRLREQGAGLGRPGRPVNWLGGNSVTVILGLVYGYIPYLILVLFAGLDRIDPSLHRGRP